MYCDYWTWSSSNFLPLNIFQQGWEVTCGIWMNTEDKNGMNLSIHAWAHNVCTKFTFTTNRLFFIVANYFLWVSKMQLFLRHKQSKGNKLVTLTSRGNKLVASTSQPIVIIHSNMLHFWVPGLLLVHQRENCS